MDIFRLNLKNRKRWEYLFKQIKARTLAEIRLYINIPHVQLIGETHDTVGVKNVADFLYLQILIFFQIVKSVKYMRGAKSARMLYV